MFPRVEQTRQMTIDLKALKTVLFYSSGGQKSEVSVSRAKLPPKSPVKNLYLLLPALMPPSFSWIVTALITLFSASIFICLPRIPCVFFSFISTVLMGSRVHPKSGLISSGDPYLNYIYSLLPNQVTLRFQGDFYLGKGAHHFNPLELGGRLFPDI